MYNFFIYYNIIMNNIIIFYTILLIIIMYILASTIENFETPPTGPTDQIKEAVKQIYLADVESIRNLSAIATKLVKEGLTIPGNLKVSGNIEVGGTTKLTGAVNADSTIAVKGISTLENVNVIGPTTFNGGVDFKNTLNYLPKGVIIAWNSAIAPVGWALCDGTNGTPNLQGRFVLGSNSSRPIGTIGGVETVALSVDQIPPHSHNLLLNSACFKDGGCDSRKSVDGTNIKYDAVKEKQESYQPQSTGGGKPHENMPPFYTLTYIIKL